ncbi:type VI secretion system-associated FHA domain protein TagH [Endozoicomonas sp. SM1973]|uniref:Type VI secretion system-associated FHA domain protein TagH n=1 Tax=Spartinivicinus marinus TaxID=2994442 RepID=A0A853IB68_9GAMM|nr:type VI secretion system-associated FHA domain protein TagH [Spartinivicinus marinus]MCX4027679.1 type VI secretion system-associated FHA domain protein TagH [Spartinivicinus marinus]NYZ69072.1 type VI secretion system-associated FHA domain protein TagH [Spartinivicinus marinus]
MELLLLVVSAQKHEMGSEASRLFHTSGGTIGRSASCDWVLPDKLRHLSGKHLSVSYHDGAFYLTDTSTNGVFINGSAEPLGRGNQYQLRHGDRIQLADYEMVVEVRDDPRRIPSSFDRTEFSGAGFDNDNLIDSAVDQDRFDPVSAFGDDKPAESASFGGFGGDDLLNGFGNGGSHDPYKGFLGDGDLQKDHDSVMDSYFEPPKPFESQWDNFNASLDNSPPDQAKEEKLESFSALDPDPYDVQQPSGQQAQQDILADFGGATEQSPKTEPPKDYFVGLQQDQPAQQPRDDLSNKSDDKDSFPDFAEPQPPSFTETLQQPDISKPERVEPELSFEPEPAQQNDEIATSESIDPWEQSPAQDMFGQPEQTDQPVEEGGFGLDMFGFSSESASPENTSQTERFSQAESFSANEPINPFESFEAPAATDQASPDQPQPNLQPEAAPFDEVSPFGIEPPVSHPAEASAAVQQPSPQPPPSQPRHKEPVIRQYHSHNQPPVQPEPPPQAAIPEAPVKMDKAFLMLLDELGIDPNTIPAQQLQVLPKIIGQITRKTIGGLIQLLMSRANLKNEFRMSVTMIQTQENNPLKFCVNEEQAIKQMLVNPMTGYLGPVEAVEEALNDFQVHQLAVMSATRSALNYMLKRLDPERLEKKFEDSKSKGVMLGNKRARYWEAYKEFYQDILEEENVFQSLFGNEFANAYEKQVQAYLNGKKGG